MLTFLLFATIGLDFNVMAYPSPREVRQAFDDLETLKAKVAVLESNQCKCQQVAEAPKPHVEGTKGDISIPLTVTVPQPAARTEPEVVECVNGKCFNVPQGQWRTKKGLFGRRR